MRLHVCRWSIAIAILGSGACTRHHAVRHAPAELAGERVEVHTRDGRSISARGERAAGGLAWRSEGGGLVQSSEVEEVVRVSHGRGALHGLLIGLAGGAAFGVAAGLASGDDEPCEELVCFTAGEKAAIFGSFFGSLGGLVGLATGALVGSRDVYTTGGDSGSERAPRFRPAGPPGSVAGLTWAF